MEGCSIPYLFLKVPHTCDEFYRVKTDDGWYIGLHRYKPEKVLYREVVIVCHGLGSNKYSWDIDRRSIAKYLKAQGFDVFLLDLRGSGYSSKPSVFGEYSYDYSFDSYALHDLPAAINYVKEKTGSEKVFWVGHSMGGMVLYAFLSKTRDESIKAGVTVGSPIDFSLPSLLKKLALEFDELVYGFKFFPVRPLSQMLSPLGRVVGLESADILVWESRNIEIDIRRKVMANGVENVSGRVMKQFIMWFEKGDFTTEDGSFSYKNGLKDVKVPILFIAGVIDGLAPPQSIYPAYELLGTDDKEFVIASKANGFHHNYAHTDLILGKYVESDIYPLIMDWFKKHSER